MKILICLDLFRFLIVLLYLGLGAKVCIELVILSELLNANFSRCLQIGLDFYRYPLI